MLKKNARFGLNMNFKKIDEEENEAPSVAGEDPKDKKTAERDTKGSSSKDQSGSQALADGEAGIEEDVER